MYVFDTPNAMDDADLEGQNIGLYSKSKFFDESKTVDLSGNIYHPLCSIDRYILNSVGIAIKFYRSKPENVS